LTFQSTHLKKSLNTAFGTKDMKTMTLTLTKSWQHVITKALSHSKFDTFIDLGMEWKKFNLKPHNQRP